MKAELLRNCVANLKLVAVRMRMRDEVDPSVIAELEAVISRLESFADTVSDEVVVDGRVIAEALAAIGKVAAAMTALSEVINRFFE